MRKRLLTLMVAAVVAGDLAAQADTARGRLAGVVYDSVARSTIAGATVQLVAAHDPQIIHGTVTDARGRYAIEGIAPGQYLVGFQNQGLDTLALETPLYAVTIRPGERSTQDLAVPSPARIVAAVCGPTAAADSTGLLIGMLRDTRLQAVVDTGSVAAVWQELVIAGPRFNSSRKASTAAVNREGWFALCGVPVGVDVAVLGSRGADSTGLIAITVPMHGLVRHDLLLGGTASVRGTVRSDRNTPVANARVQVAGRELMAVTDAQGDFRLGGIPAGSQTLEVRAIGYAPELRALSLPADGDTSVAITLTSVKRVLDTIQVVSQRVYSKDSNGFLRRKRQGFGTFFDQDAVRRQKPFDITRLLTQVPSLHEVRQGFRKSYVMRGGIGGYCTPSFFLNGMKMPSDLLGEMDMLVTPEELEGMEIYRGALTPAEFSNLNGCGAIAVWTRPPVRR